MRLVLFGVVLSLLVFSLGCEESEMAGGATQPPGAATTPAPPAPAGPAMARPAGGTEEVVLILDLPTVGEPLPSNPLSGNGPDCPQSRVSSLLGAEITSPHGVRIGRVVPEGLGAKAGLKPGDSIVKADGQPVTCPSALLPLLKRADKPRQVKLTVVRAKAASAEGSLPANAPVQEPAGK